MYIINRYEGPFVTRILGLWKLMHEKWRTYQGIETYAWIAVRGQNQNILHELGVLRKAALVENGL
jgi:hypothetical protein